MKDGKGKLHAINTGLLRNYFVDKETSMSYLDLFNHNTKLINYGLRFTGDSDFYIICDGSHRMDYALEYLDQPINAILLILSVITLIYHSALGLQVVIEDYLHGAIKLIALIGMQFFHVIMAVAGIYAVVVVSVGAGQ